MAVGHRPVTVPSLDFPRFPHGLRPVLPPLYSNIPTFNSLAKHAHQLKNQIKNLVVFCCKKLKNMNVHHSATPSMASSEVDTSSYRSPASFTDSPSFKSTTSESGIREKKFGRKAYRYACRIREHVKMGPKFSETVKGKLSLGAKIVKQGGRENIFKHIFGVVDGEKLLKASQCYLSTTAGPIAGILFVSTEKVAFCSERSITLTIPSSGDDKVIKSPYKVSIPLKMIKRAGESENKDKPEEKYITIVTEDNFEFWFMGFVRFEKALLHLQKAISIASQVYNLFLNPEEKSSGDHGLIY